MARRGATTFLTQVSLGQPDTTGSWLLLDEQLPVLGRNMQEHEPADIHLQWRLLVLARGATSAASFMRKQRQIVEHVIACPHRRTALAFANTHNLLDAKQRMGA